MIHPFQPEPAEMPVEQVRWRIYRHNGAGWRFVDEWLFEHNAAESWKEAKKEYGKCRLVKITFISQVIEVQNESGIQT